MFCVPTVASALLPTPLRVHVPYRSPAIAMGEWFAPGGSSGAFLREELLLKNFLCQRAIQTQLYNHIQMKNDVHKDWIMQFVEEMGSAQLCAGSRQLHSHTALSVPWNELLSAVMDAPDETKEVEITGTNRRIGGAPAPRPPRALWIIYSIGASTPTAALAACACARRPLRAPSADFHRDRCLPRAMTMHPVRVRLHRPVRVFASLAAGGSPDNPTQAD